MAFEIRAALTEDVDSLRPLIAASVRGLAKGYYSGKQIELSVRTVFGVDEQLISDGTYFVAEMEGRVVGCGGWSKRKTLYGASQFKESRDPELLDPTREPAKIRAFFIHPDAARKGIGRALLERCEDDAKENGFRSAEMMATLPGVPLYEACGYEKLETVGVPLNDGVEIDCIVMRKELI